VIFGLLTSSTGAARIDSLPICRECAFAKRFANARGKVWCELKSGLLHEEIHITSSIFVNDHESGLWHDIMQWLEELAPRKPEYRHHLTGEDNADAHLKRMLLGHQVLVPVTNGKLDLGPWERVHYGEFDGERPKRILFKALGIGK
jgi:secondary thiamine-phosphate synthase enzyme